MGSRLGVTSSCLLLLDVDPFRDLSFLLDISLCEAGEVIVLSFMVDALCWTEDCNEPVLYFTETP